MWKSVSVFIFLLATVSSLPLTESDKTTTEEPEELPTLATDLVPPREDAEVADFGVDQIGGSSVPSKDLLPPPVEGTLREGAVFLINLYAIKNQSGENANEILTEDAIKNTPELAEPFATVILVLEGEDGDKPVSLEELAKDLEEEGFKVEKVVEDGDTKVIKVDFDGSIEHPDVELVKEGKINGLRKKRSPHGLLSKLLNKHGGGGYGGGGYGGGGYGGGYPSGGGTVGVIPIVVVPVQGGHGGGHGGGHYGGHGGYNQQPHYHQPPQYQPPPQYYPPPQYVEKPHGYNGNCNTCGGNHGSYSQSSAQASAQSSSGSWGK